MALLSLIMLTACDDGRIYEKEYVPTESGRVARLDVTLDGATTWPEGYNLSLAGFSGDSPYASIARSIQVDANGHASIVLKGIPDDVKTLEVCITNALRRRVLTFYSVEAPATTDTIRVEIAHKNVSMFALTSVAKAS